MLVSSTSRFFTFDYSATGSSDTYAAGGRCPYVTGAPNNQISCPVPLKGGTFQYLTKPYIPGNIIDIINNGKKGSYLKPFNPKDPKAGRFHWHLNNCGTRQTDGETIYELPMYLDSKGKEACWRTNTDNSACPHREYYLLKDSVAMYCGAYAHKAREYTTPAMYATFSKKVRKRSRRQWIWTIE